MKIKKLIKIILTIFIIAYVLSLFEIFFVKINSAEDISNHNKIEIFDKDNNLIYEIKNLHEATYVYIEDINKYTKEAFIQIEDKRFYSHIGFDIISIAKTFFSNIINNEKAGASTITQQYVKNLYFSNEKSYIRKMQEIYYATRLEHIYTKDEILEGYLNTIYFSNGIYGINDASYYYFQKAPKELTIKESAILAAIIKSPTKYCPITNKENNEQRANLILKEMYKANVITTSQYEKSIKENVDCYGIHTQSYPSSVLYFKDIILKNISTSKSNLKIYTRFDTKLNNYLDNIIDSNLDGDVSIVILDNNGYIVACIGNKDYYKSQYNIATSGSRMVGSTIKPMLYYEALKYGMSTTDTFKSESKPMYINDEEINVKNFNNSYDNDYISMAYACATSDNIYAVKTHYFIGNNKLPGFLQKYNIAANNDYTTALGNVDMSLLTLTNIYNTFSTLGKYYDAKAYEKIYKDDNLEYYKIPMSKDLLDYKISYIISELLTLTFDTKLSNKNSVTGTSISLKLNGKVAAKTGLTDYDSYIIGYDKNYTIGIWSGYSDNELLIDTKLKKLPKELFYKIHNYISTSNNWYETPSQIQEKESVLLPKTNYFKTMYYLN